MGTNGSPLAPMLRSLAHRNFRLFFIGQGLSLIGTWVQQTAMLWVVTRLTQAKGEAGQAYWLCLVAFVSQIPALIVAPVSGVVSDRFPRRPILYVTQSVMLLQAVALTVLAYMDVIQIWHLLVLGAVMGVVNTLDVTARQAFMTQMVGGTEDLANAIALNSSLFNGARLVGPMLAGLWLWARGRQGEGDCFLMNALSYLAVLGALWAMNVTEARRPGRPSGWKELREGAAYAFGFPPIRAILLLLALISFVGTPYASLLSWFATHSLQGDERTFGFLLSASGVGALLGALYMASRKTVLHLGWRLTLAAAVFGAGLIVFALSTNLWLSLVALAVMGFAIMVHMSASNTILQTIVEEDKRGRVMSFYALCFLGLSPLGALTMGYEAAAVGTPFAVALGGGLCVVGAGVFALALPRLREHIRPIYRRIGVLPELAEGIQEASVLHAPPQN